MAKTLAAAPDPALASFLVPATGHSASATETRRKGCTMRDLRPTQLGDEANAMARLCLLGQAEHQPLS